MPDRSRSLNSISIQSGPVIYWMNREQRACDNWAFLKAQSIAQQHNQPLLVVFCLQSDFLNASERHFAFMLQGLMETAIEFAKHSIPFLVAEGDPRTALPLLACQLQAGAVVCDFSPLRLMRVWRSDLAAKLESDRIAFLEVDAHNCIPVWHTSNKQEFSARTIRPKINRQIKLWLDEYPAIEAPAASLSLTQQEGLVSFGWAGDIKATLQALLQRLQMKIDQLGGADSRLLPSGPLAATRKLETFLHTQLDHYELRNDPNQPVTSMLSAYLHFGQISAQRVALEVVRLTGLSPGDESVDGPAASFLEELIVRRELADNFCFYNPDYDRFAGFPNWAKQTLNLHRQDPRPWRYTDRQLAEGQTHDPLWNAAQRDLVLRGSMPGYLRMYWAKKLLEWCASPEQALQAAIDLNDTYALDGRDPNGYAGIAWSIGGVHDRPWGERPVFGTIRYMSFDGCKRKFSIDQYIKSIEAIYG